MNADLALLRRAIALAANCPPSETAFSVGCVLADVNGLVIAEGWSRARGETWHAEAVAIAAAREAGTLDQAHTLYASMEPCSVRKSGRTPCCSLISQTPIRRVVFAAAEPPTFVDGRGADALRGQGRQVVHLEALEAEALEANAHLLHRP